MSKYIDFQPARFLAALGAFGQALIILVALVASWSSELILAVEGVATAALAILGSLFVEDKAVSRAGLNAYADAVKQEAATKAANQRPGGGSRG